MSYNYPGMYTGYPSPTPTPVMSPPTYAPKYDIVKVNGENGARAFQMAPNSNTLLLDETAPIVWVAQTDGAGYKTVTPYTITPYKPEPPVDIKDLDARIKRLEEVLNDKSNTVSTTAGTTSDARPSPNKTNDVRPTGSK